MNDEELTVEEWMAARTIYNYAVTAKSKGHFVEFKIWDSGINGPTLDFLGYIKWDGCSNWDFGPNAHYPLHFCGMTEAGEFGKLIQKLYEWAAELMPEHKDELLWKWEGHPEHMDT